ncbi:hypothetical protein HY640_03565 [Candidatus Woesearchaeota archaeon]|nr:hypothetical protein [Candidatus Woesearchaeota archaeon]
MPDFLRRVLFLFAKPGAVLEQAGQESAWSSFAVFLVVLLASSILSVIGNFSFFSMIFGASIFFEIVMALLVVVALWVAAGALHAFALFVGARNGFWQTFKVCCYSFIPASFMIGVSSIINAAYRFSVMNYSPVYLWLLSAIYIGAIGYGAVLQQKGLVMLQGLSPGKAWAAVSSALLIFLVLLLGLLILAVMITWYYF